MFAYSIDFFYSDRAIQVFKLSVLILQVRKTNKKALINKIPFKRVTLSGFQMKQREARNIATKIITVLVSVGLWGLTEY